MVCRVLTGRKFHVNNCSSQAKEWYGSEAFRENFDSAQAYGQRYKMIILKITTELLIFSYKNVFKKLIKHMNLIGVPAVGGLEFSKAQKTNCKNCHLEEEPVRGKILTLERTFFLIF